MSFEQLNRFVELLRVIQTKDDNDIFLGITGKKGCGKCQPKGSKVLMANGEFKNIEDIKKGDLVLSPQHNGSYTYAKVIETTNWFSNKNYNVIELNRRKAKLYSCSHNHSIPIRSINENNHIKHFIAESLEKYNPKQHTLKIHKRKGKVWKLEWIPINIKESEPAMVYGFEIDSPSQWYITDNFMITHNSSLAIQIARRYVERYFGEKTFDVDKYVAYNNEDVIEKIHSLPKYSPLIGDEAVRFAWSRDWNKSANKELARLSAQVRTKKLIFFMNIPKLSWIDSVYRESMLDIWIWVHSTFTDRGKESHAFVFEPDDNQGEGDSWHMSLLKKSGKAKKTRIGRFTDVEKVHKMVKNHPCFMDSFIYPKLPQGIYDRYLVIRDKKAFEQAYKYINQKDAAKILVHNVRENWQKLVTAVSQVRIAKPTHKIIADILLHDPARNESILSQDMVRIWCKEMKDALPMVKKEDEPKEDKPDTKNEPNLGIVKSALALPSKPEQPTATSDS